MESYDYVSVFNSASNQAGETQTTEDGGGGGGGSTWYPRKHKSTRRFVTAAALGVDPAFSNNPDARHALHHFAQHKQEGDSDEDDSDSDDNSKPSSRKKALIRKREASMQRTTHTSEETSKSISNSHSSVALRQALLKAKHELDRNISEIDAFMEPGKERQDVLNLMQQIVPAVLVLLAYGYSRFLDRHTNIINVITMLWVFVFVHTQLRYGMAHMNNELSLVRQEMEQQEKKEDYVDALLVNYNRAMRFPHLIQQQQTRASDNNNHHYSAGEQTQLSVEQALRYEQTLTQLAHEKDIAEANSARNRGMTMLTLVRLGSYDQSFSFASSIIGLLNTFFIFLLLRVVMERLDPNFSDGVWVAYHVVAFVLIVVPLYIEVAVASYRQAGSSGGNGE